MNYLDEVINRYSCTREPITPYGEREDADKVKEEQLERVRRKPRPKTVRQCSCCGGGGQHPMKDMPCPKCKGTGIKEE